MEAKYYLQYVYGMCCKNVLTLMARWLWQILVSGKCTGTAWGQVCPQLHPKGQI